MDNKIIDLKAKRKKETKPVYLRFRKLIDPVTKHYVMALVADSQEDREILRFRKYTADSLVRAELKQPRNRGFHRLVHRLGTLVSSNIEGFENKDAHQVIKKIQKDGKIFCDAEQYDLGELGIITRYIPQSIAFDHMDNAEFYHFWEVICQYIIDNYWHDLTPDKIEQMATAMPSQEGI